MDFPIVWVKNLPYNPSTSSLYELFAKYGNIYQIRVPEKFGNCFVIYHNLESAKSAISGLNGMNFQGRYIIATLYNVDKSKLINEDLSNRKLDLENLKKTHGIK